MTTSFAQCDKPACITDYADRLVIVLPVLLARSAFAGDFSGPVVSVLDGDTIKVLHNQRAECIRLNGTDRSEKNKAYGKRPKHAASQLVFRKEVTLLSFGKDGRTIADVLLPDETNVNHTLVKDGWCWWYPKDAPDYVILAELQRRPRRSGLGLWTDPAPIPPWVSHKASREQSLDISDMVPLEGRSLEPCVLSAERMAKM